MVFLVLLILRPAAAHLASCGYRLGRVGVCFVCAVCGVRWCFCAKPVLGQGRAGPDQAPREWYGTCANQPRATHLCAVQEGAAKKKKERWHPTHARQSGSHTKVLGVWSLAPRVHVWWTSRCYTWYTRRNTTHLRPAASLDELSLVTVAEYIFGCHCFFFWRKPTQKKKGRGSLPLTRDRPPSS